MARITMGSGQRPHFFKVLLHDFSKRIKIPAAFVKHIAVEKEPRRAMILSPLGRTFHVKIEGDTENLYFGVGWEQFVDSHDLYCGYFLVFRYEGDLVFTVWVFDHTGCQKEYGTSMERHDMKDHRKIERREGTEVIKERPVTRARKKAADQIIPSKAEVANKRVKAASGAITSSTCGKSPSFKAVISRSNLTRYMKVPMAFKMENKFSGTVSEMILRDPQRRLWTVGVGHMSMNRTVIRRGWKAFSVGNNLQLGDECTFELVPCSREKEKYRMLQVHIHSRKPDKSTGRSICPSRSKKSM